MGSHRQHNQLFQICSRGFGSLRVPKIWHFPLTLIVAFTTVLRTYRATLWYVHHNIYTTYLWLLPKIKSCKSLVAEQTFSLWFWPRLIDYIISLSTLQQCLDTHTCPSMQPFTTRHWQRPYKYTVSQKTVQTYFLPEPCQISTDCENFGQKDSK